MVQHCQRCGSAFSPSAVESATCPGCLLASAIGADRAPDADDSFGNYEVVCQIGEGGMGVVYLAEQTHPVHREVALKVLKSSLAGDAILRRFETEGQALALMEHPNIAALHDAGTSRRGRPYFVMEYVDGAPITTACDQRSATIPERLGLFVQVCRAIEHAHRKGIVHRDIKPSNVLVAERDGSLIPKVIDFGIARAAAFHLTGHTASTAFGELLGTPEYMSPEQASFDGAAVGPPSDIYSLGVVLYELLTGVLPFDPSRLRDAGVAGATRIIREVIPPPPAVRLAETGRASAIAQLRHTDGEILRRTLSRDLSRILEVCLAKDPKLRYPSAAALADDIDRYLRGEPVVAHGPTAAYRVRRSVRRYRLPLTAAAFAVAAAGVLWMMTPGASPAPLQVTPLTTYQGVESSPSFSPDGKEIAFAWNGEREDNWDIYRLHIGAPSPQRLTTNSATEYAPAWSPDGKWIAYLRADTAREAHVMLMPASGGEARAILAVAVDVNPRKRRFAWSPDSRWLVIAHNLPQMQRQRLFAISPATGEERQLTGLDPATSMSDGEPSLATDGRTLVFARDAATNGQIWTVPLTRELYPAGPERRVSVPGFDDKECSEPIPVSGRDLFLSCPSRGTDSAWRASLTRPTPPRELTELGGYFKCPELSRDRKKLAFAHEVFDTNVWRLDLESAGGKEQRRERVLASTLRDQNAALSPDGARLAFESDRAGYLEIWIASADGSGARQLTFLNSLTASPLWSPDGQQIAFSANLAGVTNVYVVPAAGGALRQLTFDSSESQQPVWSPDGKWIYYCSTRSKDREIWRIPSSGGTPLRITRHGGFDLAFSPDGRWIYYSRIRNSSAAIWRVPAAGGDETMLIDSAVGGHVFATSRRLYSVRNLPGSRNCQIEVYDLGTGRTRILAVTDHMVRDRLAVSPDERSIYYTEVDADGMDLMLVSDFH